MVNEWISISIRLVLMSTEDDWCDVSETKTNDGTCVNFILPSEKLNPVPKNVASGRKKAKIFVICFISSNNLILESVKHVSK